MQLLSAPFRLATAVVAIVIATLSLAGCDRKDNSVQPSTSLSPMAAPSSGASPNNTTTAGIIPQPENTAPAASTHVGPAAGSTAIGGMSGPGGGSTGGAAPAATAGDGGTSKPAAAPAN